MKKIVLLLVLVACGFAAYYVYVDSTAPTIAWDVAEHDSINGVVNIKVVDDKGLKEVCYSLTGGGCPGEERCVGDLQSQSYDLLVEPEKCVVDPEPFTIKIAVKAADTSIIKNKASDTIELTYDNRAPNLMVLQGTRYMKRGGTAVVLYEVSEKPAETGVMLDDLIFRAFELENNKYLSFYAHPYYVEPDDFKPRIFAADKAGNFTRIRPGSVTASHAYRSEDILLTEDFLDNVKDKMMAGSAMSPLEAFVDVNDRVRKESNQKIVQLCQETTAKILWQGAFLRNLGSTKARFGDKRTYKYRSEVVSRQVHTGIDIAGLNNSQIVAANHGKVVFTGEIGIYGNVVILDHGFGVHSLYGHLNQFRVQKGDIVSKGDPIAVSGETGLAFGDHLHFEIRVDGVPVNPIEWFDDVWVANNIESFLPKS